MPKLQIKSKTQRYVQINLHPEIKSRLVRLAKKRGQTLIQLLNDLSYEKEMESKGY